MKTRTTMVCEVCKQVRVLPKSLRDTYTSVRFCSKECRRKRHNSRA